MRADNSAATELPAAQARFIIVRGRPVFAWHHAPAPSRRRGAGVVLCPPLGYEHMSAYPVLRLLAERLAALGFDTLRFDYDGTGNSAGDHEEPDRVDAWRLSIDDAIAETCQLSGSPMVALVGVRAGALLALDAAVARGGVERLVLWSPFPSGRAYTRELKALAGLTREDHARHDADEAGINAAGYFVTSQTVKALEQWTIDAVTIPPAAGVLIVDRDDRSVDSLLPARLEALGAQVTRIRPKGTAEMLLPPQFAKLPEQALAEITNWFRAWQPSSPPPAAHPVTTGRGAALVVSERYQERALRFGTRDRLFGILSSPTGDGRDHHDHAETTATGTHGEAPTIVLLNTGVERHIGSHRLYVPLSRYWAARGHLVLRYDLGGIGDSLPPRDAPDNIAYPPHMLDDASEAIAFVRAEAPRRPVIVAGLCSGGWLAFQIARQGLDVDAVLSVNPPMYLRDGPSGMRWHERKVYGQSMRDPSKWVKAFRGGAPLATFKRLASSTLGRHATARVSGVLGDALQDHLGEDLCAIAERGIRTLFVFSRGDDGLEYFQRHAQSAFDRAGVTDFIRHVVIDGAGHSFRPGAAQQTLRALMIDFVAAQTAAVTLP